MTLDTAVFKRIVKEGKDDTKAKALEALTDALVQTYRFGTFQREYVKACAKDMLEKYLKDKTETVCPICNRSGPGKCGHEIKVDEQQYSMPWC